MKNLENIQLRLLMLIVIVLLLVGCASNEPAVATDDATQVPASVEDVDGDTVTLGVISNDPIEEIEELQPLADYLIANLGQVNVSDVDIVVVQNIDDMIVAMSNGDIDVFFESAYGAAIVADASESEIALRRWKGGVEQYHSVIFANTDSEFTELDDLKGSMIAMESSESTSSFVLPIIHLADQGFDLTEVMSTSNSVDDDKVGYVFSDDDDNTIQWVVSGRVSAGVVHNLNYGDIAPEDQAKLTILAETDAIPRHVVVLSGTLDTDQSQAIIDTLTVAHESEDGIEALEIFGKTSKFDTFPEGAEVANVEMLSMVQKMRDIQG